MADDFIQVLPDGSGKRVDNSSLQVAGQTVYRQRINFADPNDALGLAAVLKTDPAATEYGVVTRLAGTATATLTGSGVAVSARPDGFLRVAIDPFSLLYDPFETFNTTDVWTPAGTAPPSVISGSLTLAPGTTVNATSYATTKPAFSPGSSGLLQYATIVTLEQGVITGNQRFFGIGIVAGSPTPTNPLTNGTVFEIDYLAGKLYASIYSGGVRSKAIDLVRPADGLPHRYAIYYKSSRVYYEIDSTIVASHPFPNPTNAMLSVIVGSINGASAPSAAPVLQQSLVGLSDTGRNSSKLSDGQFPWRTATIKVSGTLAAIGDSALVTTPHPSATFPITGAPQPTATGSITANTGIVVGGTDNLSTASNLTVTVKGTYTGVVLNFEVSDDSGTSWFPIMGSRLDNGLAESSSGSLSSTNRGWTFAVEGFNRFRVRSSAWASGQANVTVDPGTLPMVQVVSAVVQSPARQNYALFAEAAAGATTDTLVSMSAGVALGTTGSAATSNSVPAGKTLRITSITLVLVSTAAAVVSTRVRLRAVASGTAIVSSPIIWSGRIGFEGTPAAGSAKTITISIPEGMDLPAGSALAVTHIDTVTTMTLDCSINGYLY